MKKKSAQVLIVDDIPENIQLISSFLELNDIEVLYAIKGEQAIEAAESYVPELILLDIMMPEMDGFEICKILKSKETTKNIPIIFLSAKAEPDNIVEGLEAGAVDYVTKPYNSKELMSRVMTQIKLRQTTKLAEEQASELKQLEETKNKFLYIATENLKQPVKLIQKTLDQLDNKKENITTEEIKEYINQIRKINEKNFKTISNLIEWIEIQSNKVEIHYEKININKIIEDKITKHRDVAKGKNILLYKSILPNTYIYANEKKVNYIIEKLIANAIKNTPLNGEIVISAENIENYTEVTISDTSKKIKDSIKEQIFSLNKIEKKREVDLDLILCKEYVEKMEGKIWLDVEYTEGNAFKFILPNKETK